LNFAILISLIFLAVFIFTPQAEQLARSPSFLPFLIVAMGVYLMFTVCRGIVVGRIEPAIRYMHNIYERRSQPRRFWASMVWNSLMSVMLVGGGAFTLVNAPIQALEDKCLDYKKVYLPVDEIQACSQLIALGNKYHGDLSRALAARGSAYYMNFDYRSAQADYTSAIRLDPHDTSSYYNLGLMYEQLDDNPKAIAEYRAALREDPSYADASQRLADLVSH
jgi:tetratricopeptide (TPR) repeat protein